MCAGIEHKRIVSVEERRKLAYHEAGHALVSWLLHHMDPLLKVHSHHSSGIRYYD